MGEESGATDGSGADPSALSPPAATDKEEEVQMPPVEMTNEEAEKLGKDLKKEDEEKERIIAKAKRQEAEERKRADNRERDPDDDAEAQAEYDEEVKLREAVSAGNPAAASSSGQLTTGASGSGENQHDSAEDMTGTETLDEMDVKMLCQVMRGVDVTEIYSPERVNKVAQQLGLERGLSMDLLNGWDFNDVRHRSKA